MIDGIIVYPLNQIVDSDGDCDVERVMIGVRQKLCYVESCRVNVGTLRYGDYGHQRFIAALEREQLHESDIASSNCCKHCYDNNC